FPVPHASSDTRNPVRLVSCRSSATHPTRLWSLGTMYRSEFQCAIHTDHLSSQICIYSSIASSGRGEKPVRLGVRERDVHDAGLCSPVRDETALHREVPSTPPPGGG